MNFKDFTKPVEVIFNRLINKNKGYSVNPINDVEKEDLENEYIYELTEYPCKIIRDANNKVIEILYGETDEGAQSYVWKQIINREPITGKVVSITNVEPDGRYNIIFKRDIKNKISEIDLD